MGSAALATQRAAIEITGHNLSNVNTPGAARQRVNIKTSITLPLGFGIQGSGSYAQGIQSLRNLMLDAQVVRQQSLSGYYSKRDDLVNQLQGVMGESLTTSIANAQSTTNPSTGLESSLNNFFSAWQALSSNPNSDVARQNVLDQAGNVTADIRKTYERLLDLKNQVINETGASTTSLNLLSTQVAKLNDQISRIENSTGSPANDLRDQRQDLIEQMSKIANITVTTSSTNPAMVNIALTDNSSIALVNGVYGGGAGSGANATYRIDTAVLNPMTGNVEASNQYNRTNNSALTLVATNSTTAPTLGGAPIPGTSTVITPTEGELGAFLTVANEDIGSGVQPPANGAVISTSTDSIIYKINTLAANIISIVNTAHTTNSWDLNGAAGTNFFSGTNATNINVLITDTDKIAAAGGLTNPGELDATVATTIAGLRNNANIGEYQRKMTADLGASVQQQDRNVATQQLIQQQVLRQRDSISGISIDEEMTGMISYQRAFEASAHFITTIDQMLQQVMNMKR